MVSRAAMALRPTRVDTDLNRRETGLIHWSHIGALESNVTSHAKSTTNMYKVLDAQAEMR